MMGRKHRRFSGFHRAAHWLIAIPYMVLLGSGGLILLHHWHWVEAPPLATLDRLHRWTGWAFTIIVLQLTVAAFVGGHWKGVGRDFLSWLVQRPSDILWLFLVPLNAFFPRLIHLPAAGRFNAGQKLHGLFVTLAVAGFIVTGITMILVPGWLTVWRIHLLLFCGAAAFLGLHLFLALINPSTRAALSGIFTGNVSLHYMAHHHARQLTPRPPRFPHAAVSVPVLVLTLTVLAIPALIWWHKSGDKVVAATLAGPWKTAAILPGPLVMSHATNIGANDCIRCHTDNGPVTSNACLACHDEVRRVEAAKIGVHGQITAACTTCHVEHHGANADLRGFDPHSFNHDLATFKLAGAHRSLTCGRCHFDHSPVAGELHFLGIKADACTNCHTNPHADMPSADCVRCHNSDGWTGHDLLFVHNRDASFKLDAVHSTLACTACHAQSGAVPTFKGTPNQCVQCHAPVAQALAGQIGAMKLAADPHAGRVSCTDCHVLNVVNQSPQMYADACVRCHGPAYRALFYDWQRSLDEEEQAACQRLQNGHLSPDQTANALTLIKLAHTAGIHNTQAATDVFNKVAQ